MSAERDLMTEVQKRAFGVPGTTKSIAELLLLEGSGLASVSMEQVAHAAYTSKASLVRFAKQLGFDGWVSFQRAFLQAAAEYETSRNKPGFVDVNFPFAMDDEPLDAMHKVLEARTLAVKRIDRNLDAEKLKAAARAIMGAERVAIFARLPNRSFGEFFAYNMSLIGKSCFIPHGEEAEHTAMSLGEGDCGLFLSYTGRMMGEPMCYAELVAKQGGTIVGITMEGGGLSQMADIALTFEGIEHFYNKIGGFYSCTALEYLLDALFTTCYLEHYNENLAHRSTLTAGLEQRYGHPSTQRGHV